MGDSYSDNSGKYSKSFSDSDSSDSSHRNKSKKHSRKKKRNESSDKSDDSRDKRKNRKNEKPKKDRGTPRDKSPEVSRILDSGLKSLAKSRKKKEVEELPKGPFHYKGLVRIYTPNDENSLLRAILNATYKPYRSGIKDGKPFDRDKFIQEVRSSLAEKLSSPVDTLGMTYYENLSDGGYKKLASKQPEYSLEAMKKYLDSKNPLGLRFIEFISNVLGFDIYVIDLIKLDVENLSRNDDRFRFRDRNSVVIGMIDEHFETLGIKSGRRLPTFFTPDAPIIAAIWKRKQALRKLKYSDNSSKKRHIRTPEREPYERRDDRTPEKERNGHRIKDSPVEKKRYESKRDITPKRQSSPPRARDITPKRDVSRNKEATRYEELKHDRDSRPRSSVEKKVENLRSTDHRRESPPRRQSPPRRSSPPRYENLGRRDESQKKPISNNDPGINKLTQRTSPKRESRLSPKDTTPRGETVYAKHSK